MPGISIFNQWNDKLASTAPDIDEAELKLALWEESGAVMYAYVPTDKPKLLSKTGKLKITFSIVTDENHSGKKRYRVYGYTLSGKKSVQSIEIADHGSNTFKQAGPKPHVFPNTTGHIKFELALAVDSKETTYINLLVFDEKEKDIISCDPQVENTTKTGSFILQFDITA
jgi:hypothetical protein